MANFRAADPFKLFELALKRGVPDRRGEPDKTAELPAVWLTQDMEHYAADPVLIVGAQLKPSEALHEDLLLISGAEAPGINLQEDKRCFTCCRVVAAESRLRLPPQWVRVHALHRSMQPRY